MLALTADAQAPAFSPPSWTVVARALKTPDAATTGKDPIAAQEIDPGGPAGGWITVTPQANLKIVAHPKRVEIRPGQEVSMSLAVERAEMRSAGGCRSRSGTCRRACAVLNIGLNGVLVTEQQSERTIAILAEPWAQPMVRPFYAVGKAESAGTEDSSPPIELVVVPSR